MKAINTGKSYHLYNNSVKTFDLLPAQSYNICFNPKQGFWLEQAPDLSVNEKVYGVHTEKVEKVYNAFKIFNRNLGVILSGDKGIGKSIFAKLLSIKSIENGYPLIIVNSYYPGIADFINEIEQEVVVLFDEFDKTFSTNDRNNAGDPQTEMLTLFDGLSTGKKLFIITCNELKNLNDYLVNRPGRFHYHFRFDYPQDEEIREYLQDKINKEYWGEINKVIGFSKKVSINYDCLRAIAFELSLGSSFEEAIKDLNIINLRKERYDIILQLSNGLSLTHSNIGLDIFDDTETPHIDFNYKDEYDVIEVSFNPKDSIYDPFINGSIIPSGKFKYHLCSEDEFDTPKLHAELKELTPERLLIKRRLGKGMHYAL